MLGRELWDLYADHRAWHQIELTTKRSYRVWISRLLNRKSHKLQALYLLLWAFTARHRAHQRIQILLTDEDKALGAVVPGEFLDLLPNSIEEVAALKMHVLSMLEEAGLISFGPGESREEVAADVGFTTAAASTGTAASSTP